MVSKRRKSGVDQTETLLTSNLLSNIDLLKNKLGKTSDLVIRKFEISSFHIAAIYMQGMADSKTISDFLSLLIKNENLNSETLSPPEAFHFMNEECISIGQVSTGKSWDSLLLSILTGNTVLLLNGHDEAVVVGTQGWEKRAISEPTTEAVVRGPKESFIESTETNITMVRRRIKNPKLRVETVEVGTITHTGISIMYINGLVEENILQEVRERLSKISYDSVIDSGYIEDFIQDTTFSPFPQIYHTERPDVVAGNLLEGRVALFVDGSPSVLLVPVVFSQFFQSAEDYYARWDIGTFLRILRFFAFFLSLYAPAIFIATITFHQEMLPTELLITLAAQREGLPFPAFLEAMIMEVSFELLREAGIRLPKAVGQAVSIVGAIVIGQAAVEAGIVSASMVIIVAITGIANFSIPSFSLAISARLIRFILIFGASFLGLYGIAVLTFLLLGHACSLRSFGVPYLSPIAPFNVQDQKDVFIRLPLWDLFRRPKMLTPNEKRMKSRG
ncbi:spore germination protein [Fictibacillus sp. FJAT-27399]|uniref:spore germination protein n=1 Tax=Fictibacillus sp. FJAT-27399 TaxID=1729689 RepID=UPI000784E8B0|nr:spore germination protein [Fictibacillus sp. FJAT-27399]